MVLQQKLIRTCSVWRALEVVGDTATLLILEASWLGARRFDDFRNRTGLLKALLSDRLKRLVAAGLFEKSLYCESPPRHEYLITEKGRDLYWVALMLLRWERLWGSADGKIDVELTHRTCGHAFEPVPVCGHCREEIDAHDVDWCEGPGVGWMTPIYSRRRQQRDSVVERTSLFDEAAGLMGDRWASLILRSVFTGLNKYDEIRRDTAMATNILSERLSWLTEKGVLRHRQYNANPPRFEYALTQKGMDYYPALLMLLRWGDTYYVAPEGPPLVLVHRSCGQALEPAVACSECVADIRAADVDFRVIERHPGAAKTEP